MKSKAGTKSEFSVRLESRESETRSGFSCRIEKGRSVLFGMCGKLPTVHFIPMSLHISGGPALHYAFQKISNRVKKKKTVN